MDLRPPLYGDGDYEDDQYESANFTYDDWLEEYLVPIKNGSLPNEILIWLTISEVLWCYVVAIAIFSLPFYGYAFYILLKHHWRKQKCLMAIIVADSSMLCIMLFCLTIAKFWRNSFGPILCKLMIFTSNAVTTFTNWCWVMIWGWRYLTVFYPLRRFRVDRGPEHICIWLGSLLVVACIFESWTVVYTTEYNIGGVVFCELDTSRARYSMFKWVILAESVASFLLPFILIMLADVRVLYRAYAAGMFIPITAEEIGHSKDRGDHPDTAKIYTKLYKQKQLTRKHRSIMRCVLAGSIDLLLNLPDYTLQVLDNFIPLRQMLGDYRVYYGLEAFAYVLYFFQYPMIVCYVRWLIKDFLPHGRRSAASHSANSLTMKVVESNQRLSSPRLVNNNRPSFEFSEEMSGARKGARTSSDSSTNRMAYLRPPRKHTDSATNSSGLGSSSYARLSNAEESAAALEQIRENLSVC